MDCLLLPVMRFLIETGSFRLANPCKKIVTETDEDNRVLGHMMIILLPGLCSCGNVLKRANMTETKHQFFSCLGAISWYTSNQILVIYLKHKEGLFSLFNYFPSQ